jgi:hypothetical protein
MAAAIQRINGNKHGNGGSRPKPVLFILWPPPFPLQPPAAPSRRRLSPMALLGLGPGGERGGQGNRARTARSEGARPWRGAASQGRRGGGEPARRHRPLSGASGGSRGRALARLCFSGRTGMRGGEFPSDSEG